MGKAKKKKNKKRKSTSVQYKNVFGFVFDDFWGSDMSDAGISDCCGYAYTLLILTPFSFFFFSEFVMHVYVHKCVCVCVPVILIGTRIFFFLLL